MATVKGVWVFNEDISEYYTAALVNFESKSTNFGFMLVFDGAPRMVFADSDQLNTSVTAYDYPSWKDEAFRTVDFGSTEQEVPDTFYSWFTANATQQTSEEESGGVTITYNGTVIASLEAGLTATLACAGKKMLTDVVISTVTR